MLTSGGGGVVKRQDMGVSEMGGSRGCGMVRQVGREG